MSKLYEITEEFKQIESMDFDADAIADTLQALNIEFKEKAQNIIYMVKSRDDRSNNIGNEIKRLQAMKKANDSKRDWFKNYLRENMEKSGIDKIECDFFTITLRKPGAKKLIVNADELSNDYKIAVYKPNNAAIKTALADGYSVKGAELVNPVRGLVIK
jgi:Mg2+ and Co2+ transporter CorA